VQNRALLLAGVQRWMWKAGHKRGCAVKKEARAMFACGALVDMRERGMRGLHELVLESARSGRGAREQRENEFARTASTRRHFVVQNVS
jgi:hypothetical protein